MIFENRHHEDRFKVYASSSYFSSKRENYKEAIRRIDYQDKKLSLAKVGTRTINYDWLNGASETYKISSNINDYLLTEVPIVTVDVPNRNLHCFPFEEVSYFDPRFGNFIYNTFIGKPTYADHNNKVHTEAKGIHLDASLRKVPGWNVWKIYVLLAYDRTKDAGLVRAIEAGQRRSYSMGAWVSYFINSVSAQISNASQAAKYPKGTVHNGILSYDLTSGVEFFETSSVVGPADVSAESHQLWHF